MREGGSALETATDETLGIEHSVSRVHGGLVLGSITNKTLFGREGDVGRCRAVSLYGYDETGSYCCIRGCSRSLAMISTRSFCQTPTQLQSEKCQ